MKWAVISDIHGNSSALQATIYSAINNGCNSFIFLGDYGTDFIEIHEVLDMIRWCRKNFTTYVIKGNREDYILDYIDGKHPDWDNDPTKQAILIGIQRMTKEDIDFIRSLPNFDVVNLSGLGNVILSHTLILNKDLKNFINNGNSNILLFGHSHSSGNWYSSNCYIFNPGSAGLSDDGISCTYGILEGDNKKPIFSIENVQYDFDKEFQIIDSHQDICGLKAGYWGELLKMSMKLGKQLTVDFLQECARLNYILEKSKENNTSADLSPLEDYEKMFYQLKNANVDHNGIFLPFADFDIRKKYKLIKKTLVVSKDSKNPFEIVEKKFGPFSFEILKKAFANFEQYYENAMTKKYSK